MKQITVAFSTHRPEVLPFAAELMDRHEVVILEEPPVPEFFAMLEGAVDIDTYVAQTDTEFPEFSRESCKMMQKLYGAGIRLFQVEPYLEHLIRIHEYLASGGSHEDFDPATDLFQVYQSEKQASRDLMNFYKTSVKGSFDQTVEAVKRFARADARRFLMRDRMRADGLLKLINRFSSVYIEAGEMHFALWRFLKNRFWAGCHFTKHYLMGDVVREICGKQKITGPGDQLTLRYIFNPESDMLFDSLLAGQALIYNKVLQKEEMAGQLDTYPHTRDEVAVIENVRRLSFDDCRSLFNKIRFMKTADARRMLKDILSSRSGL